MENSGFSYSDPAASQSAVLTEAQAWSELAPTSICCSNSIAEQQVFLPNSVLALTSLTYFWSL